MLNKKNNASALTPLPVTAHRSLFRRFNLKTIFFTQFTGEKKLVLRFSAYRFITTDTYFLTLAVRLKARRLGVIK